MALYTLEPGGVQKSWGRDYNKVRNSQEENDCRMRLHNALEYSYKAMKTGFWEFEPYNILLHLFVKITLPFNWLYQVSFRAERKKIQRDWITRPRSAKDCMIPWVKIYRQSVLVISRHSCRSHGISEKLKFVLDLFVIIV